MDYASKLLTLVLRLVIDVLLVVTVTYLFYSMDPLGISTGPIETLLMFLVGFACGADFVGSIIDYVDWLRYS